MKKDSCRDADRERYCPVMPGTDRLSSNQVRMVLDVSRLLAVTSDLDPLLQRIAEAATCLLSCERASIYLHDIRAGELWTKVALKSGGEIRIPASAGIAGAAFTQNRIVHVPRPYEDPRFNPEPDRHSGFVTRSLLAAPMVDIDNHPLGVIQAVNKCGDGCTSIEAFSEEDFSLIQLLADQAGVAIQRYRLQIAAMEIVALRREMELARRVQDAMIPKSPPSVPGLESAGRSAPASFTGGDAFDLWRTRDGQLGVFLGDATGHGLAPTLVVSQARTLVRALADRETDPRVILSRVNARLAGDLEMGKFVTAFLGFVRDDGQLTWCSAGHGPVFIRERAGGYLHTLDALIPPLAVLDELPDIPACVNQLGAGGMLAAISDGIPEAFNPEGEMYGVERLACLLNEYAAHPPATQLDAIFSTAADWQAKPDPVDDQTAVIVTRAG